MEMDITGFIESSELGILGDVRYGFIDIKTKTLKHIKVIIASFTEYDTLSVGERVHVQGVSFSDRNIIIASKISRQTVDSSQIRILRQ